MSAWERIKSATLSSTDRWIGGVCGGLGKSTPIPSWMWRLGFLLGVIYFGAGFLLYILLWICLPNERSNPTSAQ